jgi:hypothetical protein
MFFNECRKTRILLAFLVGSCFAQEKATTPTRASPSDKQINVNWIYGAYVPKDVPLEPLTNDGRWKLYLRQTYTTPGIYVKTALFTTYDQIRNSPGEWGDGIEGFAKRIGSRQAQFIIQNSLSAAGNAAVGWEPRYDRCRCNGFWPRTRHAIVRNFVTYDRTEKAPRPQFFSYAAAFGAAAIAATWYPGNPNVLVKGYQGAITQVGVGIGVNWLAEFAPEITRVIRPKKVTDASKSRR